MRGVLALLLLQTAFVPQGLQAAPRMPAEIDLILHIQLAGMESASAPRVVHDHILFSYLPPDGNHAQSAQIPPTPSIYGTSSPTEAAAARNPRYVGVVFEHENFRTTHVMFRNEQGVHFVLYPVPTDVERLRYRFVRDGHWSADPHNPNAYYDAHGVRLSVFELPSRPAELRSPVIHNDGSVEFSLRAESGRRVSLVGDFNNWDPFMHIMREVEPGLYRIRLRVPAGRHGYQFVGAGRRINDPLNDRRLHSSDGHDVSALYVP